MGGILKERRQVRIRKRRRGFALHQSWSLQGCGGGSPVSSLVYGEDKKDWDGRQAKESSGKELKDELTTYKLENNHATNSIYIAGQEDRHPVENLQVLTNPCSHSLSFIVYVFIKVSQCTHLTALQLQLKLSGWGCFIHHYGHRNSISRKVSTWKQKWAFLFI